MGIGIRTLLRGSALGLLLCLSLATGADAQRQQIGADLNRPAQNTFDCTTVPPWGAPGASTCTYVGFSATGEYVQTPFPGGVFTRVRVKTGNTTGAMRITVARAFRSFQGPACCFYAGQSQVFTPRAAAVNRVGVRLPARNEFDPSFGETIDYLGITVLEPGVAIPGWLDPNWQNSAFGTHSSGFTPQITPQDSVSGRVDGSGTNLLPLINADFVPLCGGVSSAETAKQRRQARRAEQAAGRCLGGASPGRGSFNNRRAEIALDCNLTDRCRGKLVLNKARGKGKKLGKSKFKIASGDRKKVKVRLNKRGKRAARGSKKLEVKAKIKVRDGPNESKKLKLKR